MDEFSLLKSLDFPFDVTVLHKKKRAIKRLLPVGSGFVEARVGILGGSTTDEVKDVLELFLLKSGIKPVFYQSSFGKYFEDGVYGEGGVYEFAPKIVYIHTTRVNILNYPSVLDKPEEVERKFELEMDRFRILWDALQRRLNCVVIQNNFEFPASRILGNRDCSKLEGGVNFVSRLNAAFSAEARERSNFYINDIHYLSATFGLDRWCDPMFWVSYKYAVSYAAIPVLASSLAFLINAVYGKGKKCLVLDLDNTLWGGVIGDDGVDGIEIGSGTPLGEAYSAFQAYLKGLKERGVILAVCSKNEIQEAVLGFTHRESILEVSDFAVLKASWDRKDVSIRQIALELNIGLDSIVFIDDNPTERELVRLNIPEVEVPEVGSDVLKYIEFIDKAGYFEAVLSTEDDLNRTRYYKENAVRESVLKQVGDYGDFLRSLNMVAEIDPVSSGDIGRVAQLVNKTNQFNLTTRRYSDSEIESFVKDDQFVVLGGRLCDKFGDNGLVTVFLGQRSGDLLRIDLWLMSCRVFKRGLEFALFEVVVDFCKKVGISKIHGSYKPTSKNGIVVDFFAQLGFERLSVSDNGDSEWVYIVESGVLPVHYLEIKAMGD